MQLPRQAPPSAPAASAAAVSPRLMAPNTTGCWPAAGSRTCQGQGHAGWVRECMYQGYTDAKQRPVTHLLDIGRRATAAGTAAALPPAQVACRPQPHRCIFIHIVRLHGWAAGARRAASTKLGEGRSSQCSTTRAGDCKTFDGPDAVSGAPLCLPPFAIGDSLAGMRSWEGLFRPPATPIASLVTAQ